MLSDLSTPSITLVNTLENTTANTLLNTLVIILVNDPVIFLSILANAPVKTLPNTIVRTPLYSE